MPDIPPAAPPPKATLVPAGLWVVAALLCWTTVAVQYVRGHDVRWSLAIAGLACVAMAVAARAKVRGR